MKNFDIDNLIAVELIQSALIMVSGEICCVVDMTSESILVEAASGVEKTISENEWSPIFLDDDWLAKLGMSKNPRIKNIRTELDWIVKKSDSHFYLTIDSKLGDNPVIPLHFVHELQEWYYRLKERNLFYDISKL